ncbi:hypothetical protein [Pseudactinotalea sp. HY158]|uniref:hypothetical protein n=1 Tax=Pseudactinotalea sp. HY158 TaxID=2654547 RepID=UPI00129CC038|nr:hypothetical protein [Pseudactinotalea sp. HY158]QGH70777.1 hypothetical protein GCE65_15695 [Pseudactinotalea sp. HY158]
MEAWVFGMRRADSFGSSWARTLYYRLSGQAHRCGTTPGTDASEHLLGFERSVYLYLGRCDPAFGDTGIACERPERRIGVAPFDTGGMAQRKIRLRLDLTDDQMADLVRRHRMGPSEYEDLWAAWGRDAYDSSSEYTSGNVPRWHRCEEVDLSTDANEARAWVWEGAVLADAESCDSVRPRLVALSGVQLDRYRSWLRDSDILTSEEYRQHVAWVSRIRLDPGDLAESLALNSYLSRGGAVVDRSKDEDAAVLSVVGFVGDYRGGRDALMGYRPVVSDEAGREMVALRDDWRPADLEPVRIGDEDYIHRFPEEYGRVLEPGEIIWLAGQTMVNRCVDLEPGYTMKTWSSFTHEYRFQVGPRENLQELSTRLLQAATRRLHDALYSTQAIRAGTAQGYFRVIDNLPYAPLVERQLQRGLYYFECREMAHYEMVRSDLVIDGVFDSEAAVDDAIESMRAGLRETRLREFVEPLGRGEEWKRSRTWSKAGTARYVRASQWQVLLRESATSTLQRSIG